MTNSSSVLIVDDDKAIRDLLTEDLTLQGHICVVASDYDQALEKLADTHFDVILLDIGLPRMSGLDLLNKLSPNNDTIVIMITGKCHLDTAVAAMKLGAADYITKPFNLDRVHNSIKIALDKKHIGDELESIACGVEAQIDPAGNYTKMLIDRVIGIARLLEIPENIIESWAKRKLVACSQTKRAIDLTIKRNAK